jgi:predicted aspartyl protease
MFPFPVLIAVAIMVHDLDVDDCYVRGNLEEAKRGYEALLRSDAASVRVEERLGQICYFQGEYRQAIEHLRHVADRVPSRKERLLSLSAAACVLMDNYAAAVTTLQSIQVKPSDQLLYYRDHPPYQIRDPSMETVIPFLASDPLPVIPIEVQSQPVRALIDTGGWDLILDREFAARLPLRRFSNQRKMRGAGSKQATFACGTVDRLTMGGVEIGNVPVSILALPEIGVDAEAIVGTNLLMRFIAALDYPARRLILYPKSAPSSEALAGVKAQARLPFYLLGYHMLHAQCFLNGKPGLLCFDSGLADGRQAALLLGRPALRDLGVEPPTSYSEQGMGAGGGFRHGYAMIREFRAGNLTGSELLAVCPQDEERPLFHSSGVKVYGIISHHFLKHYRWTIDPIRRQFIFE